VNQLTPHGSGAWPAVNPAGAQGLVHGSWAFFGKQLAAGIGCSAYAFGFTYAMLKVLDLVTPVRVGAEAEERPRRRDARRRGLRARRLIRTKTRRAYDRQPCLTSPR